MKAHSSRDMGYVWLDGSVMYVCVQSRRSHRLTHANFDAISK